jgi:hypothetical protein
MASDSGAHAVVVVVDGGVERVVGRVVGVRADLALVDALARLQLRACRRGCSISVRDASPELAALLRFAGLGMLLAHEPRRQSEELEQLGVQEVVDGRDPVV